MRTIRASAVSAPVRSTVRSKLPVVLSVPPMTGAPKAFSTGTGSPVIMLSSTKEAPALTVPSAGTRSPGRTRTRSPTRSSATGTSRSPASETSRAVLGERSMSRAIAAPARPRARASSRRPSRIRVTMRTLASK